MFTRQKKVEQYRKCLGVNRAVQGRSPHETPVCTGIKGGISKDGRHGLLSSQCAHTAEKFRPKSNDGRVLDIIGFDGVI